MSRGLLRAMFRPYVEFDFARMAFDSRVVFSRSSTAARYKPDKLIEFVANNVPRIDHDPATGAVLGLLLEEQRTNLLARSQEFDNTSAWSTTGTIGTVSANAAVAPDGTTTGDKLVEASASGNHGRRQQVTGLTELTTYRFSFYAKAAERTRVRYWTFAGGDTGGKIFDMSAVTAPPGCSITPVGYGWYRCEGPVVTIAGQTSRTIHIGPADNTVASTVSYPGDGTSGVYVWGAQLESGSAASSYILTTTSATTCARDDASITIPAHVVKLVTTYGDGTTAQQTVTPGATYTIPTGTKPIRRIRGYFA